jgi:putative RecB family exonuclease
MDIHKLRSQPHLSASAINDYCDCGLRYKLSRVDLLPPESTPAEMVLGSAIHRALADFYQELKSGRNLTANELETAFENHWRFLTHDREDIEYKESRDFDTHLLEGKNLVNVFHREFKPDGFKIIGIEQPFSFNLEGLPVPIIGVYDLLVESEGVITICDTKTSQRAFSNADVDKNLQMTIYHLSKANGHNDREKILLRLDVLIKTQTPKFAQYYTSRDEVAEIKATKKIMAVWDGICKNVFIPNTESFKCPSCSYRSHCEAWFMKK